MHCRDSNQGLWLIITINLNYIMGVICRNSGEMIASYFSVYTQCESFQIAKELKNLGSTIIEVTWKCLNVVSMWQSYQ